MRSLDELVALVDNHEDLGQAKLTTEEVCWVWAYAQAKGLKIVTRVPISLGDPTKNASFVGLVKGELTWQVYGPIEEVQCLKSFAALVK